MAQVISTEPQSDNVSLQTALKTFFGLLIAAIVATIIALYPSPMALLLAWAFPLGLAAFVPGFDNASGLWLCLGYGCHALAFGFFVNFRRRCRFYSVVACYAILLLMNGVGCAREKSENKFLLPGKINCSNDKGSSVTSVLLGVAS